MQDPDVPPTVEEGETGGAEGGVPPTVAASLQAVSGNLWRAESTALPWITAIAPR